MPDDVQRAEGVRARRWRMRALVRRPRPRHGESRIMSTADTFIFIAAAVVIALPLWSIADRLSEIGSAIRSIENEMVKRRMGL
jgi:hypothetical protein